MKVKICGVTDEAEIQALDERKVDYAGIWWGIPNGRYNHETISAGRLLCTETRHIQPVLVTLSNDMRTIASLACETPTAAVQLHGFHTPAFIQKLKASLPDYVSIIKVLHFKNENCMEKAFIHRYARAGVDGFILDRYESENKIGSTGLPIDLDAADGVMKALENKPVMIAGGVNPANIGQIIKRLNPFGVDIDSAVKSGDGIDFTRVDQLIKCIPGKNG